MSRLLLAFSVLAFAACRGTVPERNAPPEQAISAILIGCKTTLPSGETRNGRIIVNFESEGGRQAEVYRLPLHGGENYLYLIEPGTSCSIPARNPLDHDHREPENLRFQFHPGERTSRSETTSQQARLHKLGLLDTP